MECAKVKQFLSEYIDGTLDKETEKLIGEHLLRCKDCSGKFNALKACVNAIGSLEKVEAPEDFLQKVHERLHRRLFGDIIRKIFVPVRVKLPLELIGTAVAAVLVIYIQSARQLTIKEMPAAREKAQLETVSGKSQELADKPASKMEKIVSAPPVKRKLRHAAPGVEGREKEKIIEIALLIKPRDFTMKGGKLDFAGDEETKKLDSSNSALQCSDEIVSRITNIAESVKGRVLQVEREKNTGLLGSIAVEVPLKNYSLFLGRLGQLGIVRKPLPAVKDKNGGFVNVRIKFEFTEK